MEQEGRGGSERPSDAPMWDCCGLEDHVLGLVLRIFTLLEGHQRRVRLKVCFSYHCHRNDA